MVTENVAVNKTALNDVNGVVSRMRKMIYEQQQIASQKEELRKKIEACEVERKRISKELDTYVRASTLIGNVSDSNITDTLKNITGVINRALSILFVDKREVSIEKVMHKNTYPHFNIVLKAEDGSIRTFDQSGSGLAEVISFLYDICLIDLRGGRKIIVADEIMNGLHPSAKKVIKEIMMAMTPKFKFIITEYMLDIGTQYEVIKENGTARVVKYDGDAYYLDTVKKLADKEES